MSGPTLHTMIKSYGAQRFIEFDDGEIAFASGIPSVSGFGLTGDIESVHALENGNFFTLMEKRGVTLVACSWQYHHGTQDVHFDQGKDGMWGGLRGSEFAKYYWKYLGNTQDIYFYRLTAE